MRGMLGLSRGARQPRARLGLTSSFLYTPSYDAVFLVPLPPVLLQGWGWGQHGAHPSPPHIGCSAFDLPDPPFTPEKPGLSS